MFKAEKMFKSKKMSSSKFMFYLITLIGLNFIFSRVIAQQAAEVPDIVKIPQPSIEELALATVSLDSYVRSLDADMLSILERFPQLLEVRPPRVNTAIVPSLSRNFLVKHNNNLEVANAGDIDVLFMGDSITDFWRNETGNYAGKPVLDKYFGDLKLANFGIAGDTTQGVLYRLQNGEGQGFSPKAIMLMIGTNNTRLNTSAEIAEGVGAIVLEMQNDFPEARILLLGVFPRGNNTEPLREVIDGINQIISQLDDGEKVVYLDIGEIFLDVEGNVPVDVMSDGLHPTTKGYELWAEAVVAPLNALLQ